MPSKGIKIFGSLAIFFGIIGILFGIGNGIGISIQSPKWIGITIPGYYSSQYLKIGIIIMIILYGAFLISGVGILMLKSWAPKLIIGLSAIALLLNKFYGYYSDYFTSIKRIDGINIPPVIPVLIIFLLGPLYYIFNFWFFNRSGVKKQFQK